MISSAPRAALLFVTALLAACASPPAGNADGRAGAVEDPLEDSAAVAPAADSAPLAPAGPATLESVRADIERAIGDARAESLSACRLVGLGERPCGGPRAYVAYSVTRTDSAQLAALVEAYGRLDRERNEREGLMSTCEVVARPAVEWEGGRCVVGGGG